MKLRVLKPRAEAGFTMAELMVTMLLMAIVLLGLAALQVGTIRQVTQSKRSAEASRLAQQMIEYYRTIGYDDPDLADTGGSFTDLVYYPGTTTKMQDVSVDGLTAGPFSVSTMIENPFTPTGSTLTGKLITVRVTWYDVHRGNRAAASQKYQIFEVTLSTQRYQL